MNSESLFLGLLRLHNALNYSQLFKYMCVIKYINTYIHVCVVISTLICKIVDRDESVILNVCPPLWMPTHLCLQYNLFGTSTDIAKFWI